MIADDGKVVGNGEYLLILREKNGTTTIKVIMEVPLKVENSWTIRYSYTTFDHIPE